MADRIAGAIADLAYQAEHDPKIAVEVLIGHSRCHVIIETTAVLDEGAITAAMAVFEFSHLTASATKVVRCQNPECRKFFTAKRTSAKYCPFLSPQNPGRTCNDY